MSENSQDISACFSRIGVTEKLRVVGLNPFMAAAATAATASGQSIDASGNASMPADLTAGGLGLGASATDLLTKAASVPIKPNREKIRAVLAMSNVIELQRHLLTTVMENEVSASELLILRVMK